MAAASDDGTVRVDAWLHAVRICTTRTEATESCRGGHVKVNGTAAKPAHPVRPGDRITGFIHGRRRDVEVTRAIAKRVGAPVAATCLIDHSPPPEPADELSVIVRSRGDGRPTKRDRRRLDDLRGR